MTDKRQTASVWKFIGALQMDLRELLAAYEKGEDLSATRLDDMQRTSRATVREIVEYGDDD